MPTTNNRVRMKYCTWSQFSGITPDGDTLYYITDKRKIYLGSVLYGGATNTYGYSAAYSSNTLGGNITYTVANVTDSAGSAVTPVNGDLLINTAGVIAQVTTPGTTTGTAQVIGKIPVGSSSGSITINEGYLGVN